MRARMLMIISVAATLVGCATAMSSGNIQADSQIEANAPQLRREARPRRRLLLRILVVKFKASLRRAPQT